MTLLVKIEHATPGYGNHALVISDMTPDTVISDGKSASRYVYKGRSFSVHEIKDGDTVESVLLAAAKRAYVAWCKARKDLHPVPFESMTHLGQAAWVDAVRAI